MEKDLSYCSGVCCKIKEKCVRYTEFIKNAGKEYPVWFVEPKFKNNNCFNFVKNQK